MNVTYEKKDAMTFIGYHTEIRPEEGYQKCPEFWDKEYAAKYARLWQTGYQKCPEFWDKEYAAKYARLWQTMKPENAVEKAILENGIGMFAICADSENAFTYWIAGLYKGGEVPGGLELYSFPATAVWQEWFPNEGQKYHANGNATLEVYSAGNPQSPDYECGIWVPISGRSDEYDANEYEAAEIITTMMVTGIL